MLLKSQAQAVMNDDLDIDSDSDVVEIIGQSVTPERYVKPRLLKLRCGQLDIRQEREKKIKQERNNTVLNFVVMFALNLHEYLLVTTCIITCLIIMLFSL